MAMPRFEDAIKAHTERTPRVCPCPAAGSVKRSKLAEKMLETALLHETPSTPGHGP